MYDTPFLRSYAESKSTSKPFPIKKLRFFLDYLTWRVELENIGDDGPVIPDINSLCEIPSCNFLKYITNGEFIYEAYQIFIDLTSKEPEKEPILFREAIFSEIMEGATECFLDEIEDNTDKNNFKSARALFDLYEYCQVESGGHVWTDKEGKKIEPPPLDKLTREDWEDVINQLRNFFFWDDDWNLPIVTNFSQYVEQPHCPTFSEYRRAYVWIQDTARALEELEEGEHLITIE